jgi:hypothetical protein
VVTFTLDLPREKRNGLRTGARALLYRRAIAGALHLATADVQLAAVAPLKGGRLRRRRLAAGQLRAMRAEPSERAAAVVAAATAAAAAASQPHRRRLFLGGTGTLGVDATTSESANGWTSAGGGDHVVAAPGARGVRVTVKVLAARRATARDIVTFLLGAERFSQALSLQLATLGVPPRDITLRASPPRLGSRTAAATKRLAASWRADQISGWVQEDEVAEVLDVVFAVVGFFFALLLLHMLCSDQDYTYSSHGQHTPRSKRAVGMVMTKLGMVPPASTAGAFGSKSKVGLEGVDEEAGADDGEERAPLTGGGAGRGLVRSDSVVPDDEEEVAAAMDGECV